MKKLLLVGLMLGNASLAKADDVVELLSVTFLSGEKAVVTFNLYKSDVPGYVKHGTMEITEDFAPIVKAVLYKAKTDYSLGVIDEKNFPVAADDVNKGQ